MQMDVTGFSTGFLVSLKLLCTETSQMTFTSRAIIRVKRQPVAELHHHLGVCIFPPAFGVNVCCLFFVQLGVNILLHNADFIAFFVEVHKMLHFVRHMFHEGQVAIIVLDNGDAVVDAVVVIETELLVDVP